MVRYKCCSACPLYSELPLETPLQLETKGPSEEQKTPEVINLEY